jgi:hypothetical protein
MGSGNSDMWIYCNGYRVIRRTGGLSVWIASHGMACNAGLRLFRSTTSTSSPTDSPHRERKLNMTLQEAMIQFEELSRQGKVRVLAAMMMALTVQARSETIDVPPEEAAIVYRGINELQHQVANQLSAYLSPKGQIPSDQVFGDILQYEAEKFRLQRSLQHVLAWAFSRED